MSETTFFVGPLVDPDRYRLHTPIGAGAEGILYRGSLALESGTVLDVAVKMLHPHHHGRLADFRRRWGEQVELLRSLQAPGVVGVRDGFSGPLPHHVGDASAEDETVYLVMNWVDGIALDEWIDANPQLTPAERLKLLLPVAGALDLMHSGNATSGIPLIHGDIKPSNILVNAFGETILVDFGLMRLLPGGQRETGVDGTAGYVAPEVYRDGVHSPASDRYGVGGVAYFLLTGQEPPPRARVDELRSDLLAAHEDNPELVEHALEMLADDPESRPRVIANWCAQLRNSSLDPDHQPTALPPVAPGRVTASGGVARRAEPLVRRLRSPRRPRPALAVLAVAAIIAGGTVVLSGRTGDGRSGGRGASDVADVELADSPIPSIDLKTDLDPEEVAGQFVCENSFLGYTLRARPDVTIAAETTDWPYCSGFGFDSPPPDHDEEVRTTAIAFAAHGGEVDSLLGVDDKELTRGRAEVGGRSALVLEHRLLWNVGLFPVGSEVTTFLIDMEHGTLAAQMVIPPSDLGDADRRRKLFNAMMAQLTFTPSSCRNLHDPRCGPFYWDPVPDSNSPLDITVSIEPVQPRVGDEVHYTVTVNDLDADQITERFATFEDNVNCDVRVTQGGQLARTGGQFSIVSIARVPTVEPTRMYGHWEPPSKLSKPRVFTYEQTYSQPCRVRATFGYESRNSEAEPANDPYASSGQKTIDFVVQP